MAGPANRTRSKLKIEPFHVITNKTKKKRDNKELIIQDVFSDVKKKSYEYRKYQKVTSEDKKIEKEMSDLNHGIEFDGSDEETKKIFGKVLENEEEHNINYIYVISKKVDNRTFIKVGVSERYNEMDPLKRIREAQTFLIPGLQNIGFKIHFIYKYRESKHIYNNKPNALFIEQKLHNLIRTKHASYVMNFMSGVRSEWYLPDESYLVLFDLIKGFISVQKPFPDVVYECKNGEINELIIEKDQRQFVEFKIEISKKPEMSLKVTKEMVNKTKGNLGFWQKKFVKKDPIKLQLDNNHEYVITGIEYRRGKDPLYELAGEYYVCYTWKSEVVTRSKRLVKPVPTIPYMTQIEILENGDDGEVIGYKSHVYDVLDVLKKNGHMNKGEDFEELESNYNWYKEDHMKKTLKRIEVKENREEVKRQKTDMVTIERQKLLIEDFKYLENKEFIDDEDDGRYKVKRVDYYLYGKSWYIVGFVKPVPEKRNSEESIWFIRDIESSVKKYEGAIEKEKIKKKVEKQKPINKTIRRSKRIANRTKKKEKGVVVTKRNKLNNPKRYKYVKKIDKKITINMREEDLKQGKRELDEVQRMYADVLLDLRKRPRNNG